MFRQLRALFHRESPLPAHIHYHLDDGGRQVLCDESRCRPSRPDPYLLSYLHGR